MEKKGFTLIELLVVIAIIAIIAAMLLPATQKAITNAKNNRALAEMAQFAAIIQQVYSEVGYYVRLEDVVKPCTITDDGGTPRPYDATYVRVWDPSNPGGSDYQDGISDDTLTRTLANVKADWAGPYTTYKKYVTAVGGHLGRPTDPWGQEYRMFWSNVSSPDINPAGANGTMLIISGGADKNIDESFATFASDTSDDLYFNFNAGIQ